MKLNKSKNKGKVHPSPSSSSSSATINVDDPISSLNHLLPTAILTLISILSLQDREALAYMITHSLKSSTLNYCSYSNFDQKSKKKSNKKSFSTLIPTTTNHSSPCFDCCCFDCFSHFWNRWDSSTHSELIHQAIEAFEEHLASTEKTKTTSSKKKKDNNNGRSSSRKKEKTVSADVEERESCGSSTSLTPEILPPVFDDEEESSKNEVKEEVGSPEILVSADVEERENEEHPVSGEESGAQKELQQHEQQQHKGLARKVLPDVIGLFHSRFWKNLWGPNV
ncbi:uncharacterized protein LOC110690520 [Chenopodium quinoa]|uniref:uncharacterized protein LOC110690520 n=1 Tax=Chenopodium quinoa TaxID=63459 RepID=UPI000B7779B5|nr:uncharacterized protein LOC110690520 [Chenopodium quinoa]